MIIMAIFAVGFNAPTALAIAPIFVAEEDGGGIDLWISSQGSISFKNVASFTTQKGKYGDLDEGDAIAIGNVWGDYKEEIIIAEDANGGIDVWTWHGGLKLTGTSFRDRSVYGAFDEGDAFAVGDVMGDDKAEIIIAEDADGGIDIWSWDANWNFGQGAFRPTGASFHSRSVYGAFDEGDVLAVGDVVGDDKAEIIIAEDASGGIDIWSWDATWDNNKGAFRPTGDSFPTSDGIYGAFDKGDAFAVGDVLGDDKAEIIIAEDNQGGVDIWRWNDRKKKFRPFAYFESRGGKYGNYDSGDAFAVGDVLDGGKEEIIVAEDANGGIDIWSWAKSLQKIYHVTHFRSIAKNGSYYDKGDKLIVGKPEPTVCISGTISDGHQHPLIDVHLILNDHTNKRGIETHSDGRGRYRICTPPGIQASLTAILENSEKAETADIRVVNQASDSVYITTNIINLNGDITQDIDFANKAIIGLSNVSIQDLPDYAVMYYHTHQALDLAQNWLELKLDSHLPEDIFGFDPRGVTFHCSGICEDPLSPASASPDHIVIGINDSAFADFDRPDNREWHEFGHHIMHDSPMAGDNSEPILASGDSIDGGFYGNQSTSASLIDGWAEFVSLVIADVIDNDPQPHLYRWEGGSFFPPLNGGNHGGPNDDLEHNWRVRQDEDFAVAGILWDLYDNVPGDDDNVNQLTLKQIYDTVAKPNVTNLRQVYLEFESLFNNMGLNTNDLNDIFVAHGASGEPYTDSVVDFEYTYMPPPGEPYDDQNGNGIWDERVNFGYTPDHGDQYFDQNMNGSYDPGEPLTEDEDGIGIYNPPRPWREKKPLRPGSYLCVTIMDESNTPLSNCELIFTREDGASYTMAVSKSPSKLYFHMPPEPTGFQVVAHKEGKRDSEPLAFNSELYWRETRFTGKKCFLTHTFVLEEPPNKTLIRLIVLGGSAVLAVILRFVLDL